MTLKEAVEAARGKARIRRSGWMSRSLLPQELHLTVEAATADDWVIWNDPKWVGRTPILTTLLLESANVGQIARMWTHRTAAGQSISSWVCVNLALWLWANFYRVITPEQLWARRTIKVGIALNSAVILSAIWFRYLA